MSFLGKLFGGGNTGFSGGGIGSSEKITANTTQTTDRSQNTAANQGGIAASSGGSVVVTDSGAIKGALYNSESALTHAFDFAEHVNKQAQDTLGQGFQTNAAQVQKFLAATNVDSGARVQAVTQNAMLIVAGVVVALVIFSNKRRS